MKVKDLGPDADNRLPAIAPVKVEPIPKQVFEAGQRVQHRQTLEVRIIQSVEGDTLLFEPNGVTGDAQNYVVMPEAAKDLGADQRDAQQTALARTHPASAANRDYHNADALIKQLEGVPVKVLGRVQREQYAEALSLVGRYEEAAKLTGDPEKAKEWKVAWKAVWIEDDKTCKCKDTETVVMEDGKPTKVTISPRFIVKRIFSHKHNNFVDLEACNICSFKNAR